MIKVTGQIIGLSYMFCKFYRLEFLKIFISRNRNATSFIFQSENTNNISIIHIHCDKYVTKTVTKFFSLLIYSLSPSYNGHTICRTQMITNFLF